MEVVLSGDWAGVLPPNEEERIRSTQGQETEEERLGSATSAQTL